MLECWVVGQTLTIWRWRRGWPFRSEVRVLRRLGEDRAPWGLTRFGARGVAEEIRGRFGGDEASPFCIDVCDFAGWRADWMVVSCGWSTPPEALEELARMCAQRGLHVHAG